MYVLTIELCLQLPKFMTFQDFPIIQQIKKTPLSFRAEVTLTKSLWHMLCNKTKQIFAFLVFFHDHNGAPSQSLFTPSIMNIKEIIICVVRSFKQYLGRLQPNAPCLPQGNIQKKKQAQRQKKAFFLNFRGLRGSSKQ